MSSQVLKKFISEFLQPYAKGTIRNADAQNVISHGYHVRTQVAPGLGNGPVKLGSDAACVIIMGPRNKFLAVSRKHDPTDFGFPGGLLNKNEDPLSGALRELQEETGVIGKNPAQLASLRGSDGRKVHFYTCEGEGEIDTRENGLVKWVSPTQLLNGTFGNEARLIFQLLGLTQLK